MKIVTCNWQCNFGIAMDSLSLYTTCQGPLRVLGNHAVWSISGSRPSTCPKINHRIDNVSRLGSRYSILASVVPPVEAVPCVAGTSHREQDVWMYMMIGTAVTQYLENTNVGSMLSGPLIAIGMGLIGSGVLHVLPIASPVFDIVSTWLLPLGVAMYVIDMDLSNFFSRKALNMTIAFLAGAVATCVGTVVSFSLFSTWMGTDSIPIASALCASYIGGSVNFAAVISALGTSVQSTIPAAMSADNLMMGLYIASLMFLSSTVKNESDVSFGDGPTVNALEQSSKSPVTPMTLASSFAVSTISVRLATMAAQWFGMPSFALALVSIVACVVAPGAARVLDKSPGRMFAGSSACASLCMSLFFCTIGAQGGDISAFMNKESAALFAFILVQLMVQLSISLATGKLMKIPLDVMLIACNANVGGAATAVAMCISKQWNHLVNQALLMACFGYIIGSPCGIAMARLLQTI